MGLKLEKCRYAKGYPHRNSTVKQSSYSQTKKVTEETAWNQERQPNPPYFGQARLLPRWWVELVVSMRRGRCIRIIEQAEKYCSFEPGLVSLVILCCKRLYELKRLYESLRPFLEDIETYRNIEKILVDNGSGEQLVKEVETWNFFNHIIAHRQNLGMATALNRAYLECRGEYILLLEEDFVLEYHRPFLENCLQVFNEYPEIGIIRLKNQNNWWKPQRRIAPLRSTSGGVEFWTWLPARHWRPSLDRILNVWSSGSVLFRKVSFFSTGRIPEVENVSRDGRSHQGYVYEYVYGQRYNKVWLAAKIKNCYPFFQPNDTPESSGWGEVV